MVATNVMAKSKWVEFVCDGERVFYTVKVKGTNCFMVFMAGKGLKPKHLYNYGMIKDHFVLCTTSWKVKWAFVHKSDLHSCAREVFDS